MRAWLFIVAFAYTMSTLTAQAVSPVDSLSITQKIDDWNKAWDIKDASLAALWYSDQADFTNAFGFSMVGRSAIEEYLSRVFKMGFVMAGHSEQTSIKLKYISDSTVLVISTIERRGQELADGSQLGLRKTTHHRLFQKDGQWAITAHLISDARSIKNNKH